MWCKYLKDREKELNSAYRPMCEHTTLNQLYITAMIYCTRLSPCSTADPSKQPHTNKCRYILVYSSGSSIWNPVQPSLSKRTRFQTWNRASWFPCSTCPSFSLIDFLCLNREMETQDTDRQKTVKLDSEQPQQWTTRKGTGSILLQVGFK